MDATRTILVLGGGPAGSFAAMAARRQDPAALVILLNDEPGEPYEKPPLSKAVLLGKAQAADARIAGPAGLAGHDVVLETHARCVSIDRAASAVVLADGRRLRYDALVLATGACAREIPALPAAMPGVHYLRTEAHAARLKGDLAHGRKLLVVGGGLIGLEVAASAAELGMQTTVVEMLPRILARVCDAETSALVHAAHADHGVDIRLQTGIAAATSMADGRIEATTTTGERLVADVVVVGTGARPNDGLAAEAGLATDDGIIVDDRCRTSDPRIFAAGDAVRFPGPHGPVRLENWRHALDQGSVAGRNAAGAQDVYATLPSFWSEQYDLYIQGLGWSGPTSRHVRRPMPNGSALAFDLLDDRIVYALGINAQRDLAAVRRLIDRKIPVDPAALADPAQPFAVMLKARA